MRFGKAFRGTLITELEVPGQTPILQVAPVALAGCDFFSLPS
jgi:hypothetical protein